MLLYFPKDSRPDETRVALTPEGAARLVKLGAEVAVESGAGFPCAYTDDDYVQAGATIITERETAAGRADIVLCLNKPTPEYIGLLRPGALHIGCLEPFQSFDLIDLFAARGVNAISMEMVPRTTLAQKMDALSSQANLAGYVAVILAAERLNQVLPMMMTPAGTLKPARVFIIGCGVAGLQAIATAKRLGARVDAFDTRPVVEEQVHSLGAKFVKIDLGDTGQTKDGYARELTVEQRQRQQEAMAKVIAQSDIVVTTAQVFGRSAPRLMTLDHVRSMRPGSIIVDMAVESGGNVEGSQPGEEVLIDGVRVIGLTNLAGRVPVHASQMYSSNVVNLVEHFWDKEAKSFVYNLDDEILSGCLIVHDGELRNEMLKNARATANA